MGDLLDEYMELGQTNWILRKIGRAAAKTTSAGGKAMHEQVILLPVASGYYSAFRVILDRMQYQGLLEVDHSRMVEAVFLVRLTDLGVTKYRELDRADPDD